jgi:arabinofuranosyltransferase
MSRDPISMTLVLAAIVIGFRSSERRLRLLSLGLSLALVYLFVIGGDFMGGRFLSCPVYVAVIVLVRGLRSATDRPSLPLLLLLVACLPTVRYTVLYSERFQSGEVIDSDGIADERAFYYSQLGLIPSLSYGTWWRHPWLAVGKRLREKPGLYLRATVGMVGYAAGPSVHLLDPYALTNPYLSRLPARDRTRPGHHERAFPDGYIASELRGVNVIRDPALARLYDDVRLVTRGRLITKSRFAAILRLSFFPTYRDVARGFDRNAVGLMRDAIDPLDNRACFGAIYGAATTLVPRVDSGGVLRVKAFSAP